MLQSEGQQPGLVTVPASTRWDEVQYADLQQIVLDRHWPNAQAQHLKQALAEDLAMVQPPSFGSGVIDTLSPSAIEDYLECPFIFAAKRLFMLSDASELELEVDAIRRGNLMHKLFELLTEEPRRFTLSEDELDAIVEKARVGCELQLADERLWPMLRTRHKDLARRFLAFEYEDRQRFPGAKTLARELKISGFIDPETGSLEREPRPGFFKFVGRIDRVDIDESGNVVIYDYKSSAASAAQFGSWLKNNKIQLLLYAMAIEQGLGEIGAHPVLAALYYVARPLGKDSGFKIEEIPQGLYDATDKRKRNRVTEAVRVELFNEAKERILLAVKGIREGRFAPQPREHKKCIDCKWSSLCRAPHLN
jgi:RecB family exonuclease